MRHKLCHQPRKIKSHLQSFNCLIITFSTFITKSVALDVTNIEQRVDMTQQQGKSKSGKNLQLRPSQNPMHEFSRSKRNIPH